MLKIFSNSLIMHTLYTRIFSFIFAMWDFVSCFKCARDVAAQGASDACVEDESSIFTYGMRECGAILFVGESFFKQFNISR